MIIENIFLCILYWNIIINISIYFYDINLISIIYIIIFIIFKILKNLLQTNSSNINFINCTIQIWGWSVVFIIFARYVNIRCQNQRLFRDFDYLIIRTPLSTYARHLSSRDTTININYWYVIDTNVISIISLKYQQL